MNQIMHHPKHGAKIATHEQEIKNDEKEGWVKFNPEAPKEEVKEPPKEAPVNALEAKRKYTRKVIQ